jgi:hypothetical protein
VILQRLLIDLAAPTQRFRSDCLTNEVIRLHYNIIKRLGQLSITVKYTSVLGCGTAESALLPLLIGGFEAYVVILGEKFCRVVDRYTIQVRPVL